MLNLSCFTVCFNTWGIVYLCLSGRAHPIRSLLFKPFTKETANTTFQTDSLTSVLQSKINGLASYVKSFSVMKVVLF